ncbi:MAG: hypothetical protein ACR2J6_00970 [Thermoleophilaceae bacterium]
MRQKPQIRRWALRGVPAVAVLAIVAVAAVFTMPVQGVSDNQASHLALVRALASGTATIDSYAQTTDDKVRLDGHVYSNKAPGLALSTVPAYLALDAAGVPEAARRAAARRGNAQRDADRGLAWAVGLAGNVLPAVVLLGLVCALGNRVAFGFGPAAAVTLGLGTLLLPFSTMLFAHALSALLGFAAFAVLWAERRGPPRLALLAVAGTLAGLAVTTEYTVGIVAVVLGVYSLARGPWLRRAAAYGAGAVAGVLPLAIYNTLAFGSPAHVSYEGVEAQSSGLFGVRLPDLGVAWDLLAGERGLFTLSPVLAMAVVGLFAMHRDGKRSEAYVVAAICAGLFAANSGFYLDPGASGADNHPFGGFSPGPRLLVPMLPFMALGLAAAYRRLPRVTAVLALLSAARMLLATLTEPLVGPDTGVWAERLSRGDFTATVFTEAGLGNGWLAIAPVLGAAAGAGVLAYLAARWAPEPGQAAGP